MKTDKFSYKVFFERVFDPIALYRTREKARPVDVGGIVFFDVNPAYERVMKVKRGDIIGRSFLEVWPMAEERWASIVADSVNQGRTMRCEGESRDTRSYLEAIAFPLSEDMAAAIFQDRTEWKRSDDALKRHQEELRALATRLTLSEENTRRAIATDLHDQMGYKLVSLLNRLRALQGRALPPGAGDEVRDLIADTERIIAGSRDLIFELSPPILKEIGLNPALETLAGNLLEPRGIRWKFSARGEMDKFCVDDAICVLLYRMTRELLLNVIKHSEATQVMVTVNRGPGRITVIVEDNGRGFPRNFNLLEPPYAGHVTDSREGLVHGFGLFSIRERLLPIGGSLKVISEPGAGAMVVMSCPLTLRPEQAEEAQ
ncbi:MAG: histidine kinase [Fretibacterium sp.]|nr:histidine kinase [Fretibacterium sp.]